MKMSLQCTSSRILELITSGNVILSSPSFNEKTTAGFEGGGVIVLTPKYTFVYHLDQYWSGFKLFFSAMVAPWHGADGHPCFRTVSKTWRLAVR